MYALVTELADVELRIVPTLDLNWHTSYLNTMYAKELYQWWRKQTIEYLGGKCVHCGSIDNLEIDHIDESTKSFCISHKWSMKDKDKLQTEIDKCQLLCQDCHKAKSIAYMKKLKPGGQYTHGTIYAWMRMKCKCDTCLAAKRIWNDARNAKRRLKPGEGVRGPYKT